MGRGARVNGLTWADDGFRNIDIRIMASTKAKNGLFQRALHGAIDETHMGLQTGDDGRETSLWELGPIPKEEEEKPPSTGEAKQRPIGLIDRKERRT